MLRDNINILCTRPLSDHLLSETSEKGISITCVSFVKTQAIATPETTDRIRLLASRQIVAVFTSSNAVEAVIEKLHQKPNWEIFCIGGVTKDVAYTFFGKEQVIATGKNATALSEKIIAHKATEVVFFCGDQRLNELPETLAAHNILVEEIVVYTTVQTPQAIDQSFKGVLFFSPSAVHSFFSVNTVPLNVPLFAIGKTTAATIKSYCTNKIIISDWPGQESIVDKVVEHYGEQMK